VNGDDDKRFTDAVRRALDDAAERLDAETVARLRAARHRALEAARAGVPAPRPRARWLWPAATAAFASATVAVVAAWLWFASPAAPPIGFEDLELLVTAEHPEFYEDLDFYAWLAEQEHAT
jgi:hypothetical protein